MDTLKKPYEDIVQSIRNQDYDTLQKHVYVCFANGCIVVTSFLQKQGEPGWSADIRDEHGHAVFSEEEQKEIEDVFAKATWLIPFFTDKELGQALKQEGGALSFAPGGTMLSSGIKLTGDDLSMDKAFEAMLKKTEELDQFWATFAKNDPGFSKLITEGDIPVPTPNPAITIPVPKKPLVQLLITLIDLLRMSSGFAGQSSTFLTLIVLLEELVTGQWRQMIMTSLAFLSPSGMATGVVFKYIINAWQLINPELRTQLAKDMYKGSKSLLVGFLLWAASTLPPEFIRTQISAAIEQLRTMVTGLQDKLDTLTGPAKAQLEQQGLTLVFPKLELDALQKLSIEDIQNLQVLASWPVIVCTQEFQDILNPLKADPIMRLIIELMNIPIIDQDILKVCGTKDMKSIGESLAESAKPAIVPLAAAAQGGGKRKQSRRAKRTAKRQSRKTRS